jgi:hypothetical protein
MSSPTAQGSPDPEDAGRRRRRATGARDDTTAAHFDRRLLERTAAARWTLLVSIAAGLAGTLLLLAQMTLLAAVIAGAAEGRLRQVPATMLAAVVAIVAARAGLARVVEVSGRRRATRVLSAMRAELVGRHLRRGAAAAGGGSAELARERSRGSTASRPTSPAICPRWSWRSWSRWPCCAGAPPWTSPRPWSWP